MDDGLCLFGVSTSVLLCDVRVWGKSAFPMLESVDPERPGKRSAHSYLTGLLDCIIVGRLNRARWEKLRQSPFHWIAAVFILAVP